MSWSDTNRYYAALRQVEAELDRRRDGAIPWSPEYAAIFGDRDGLVAALRLRWQRMTEAQVDAPDDAPFRRREQERGLAAAHPGLLLALARTHVTAVGAA